MLLITLFIKFTQKGLAASEVDSRTRISPLPPDDPESPRVVPNNKSITRVPVFISSMTRKSKDSPVLPGARQPREPMQVAEGDLSESSRQPALDHIHVLEGPDPFREVVRAQQEWMLNKMTESHGDMDTSTTSLPIQPRRTAVESTAGDIESTTVSEQRVQQPTRDYNVLQILDAVAQLQRQVDAIRARDGTREESPPTYESEGDGVRW
jgi:hypothetical protein